MAFDISKLGVKRNIPKVDFLDYAGLIQGEPKIGKTSFVRHLLKTILVAFEAGYDAEVIDYIDCTGEDGWPRGDAGLCGPLCHLHGGGCQL